MVFQSDLFASWLILKMSVDFSTHKEVRCCGSIENKTRFWVPCYCYTYSMATVSNKSSAVNAVPANDPHSTLA